MLGEYNVYIMSVLPLCIIYTKVIVLYIYKIICNMFTIVVFVKCEFCVEQSHNICAVLYQVLPKGRNGTFKA